jgi:hypothetical protein
VESIRTLREELADRAERFGYRAVITELGYRVLRRCGIRRYVAVVLPPDAINPRSLENTHGFATRFLSDAEVLHVSETQPEFFSREFVSRALLKRDRCFGIFDGEHLVSCGWYSRLPTDVKPGLKVSFSPDYVYMYKGYTAESYRGKRLHALGMAQAILACAQEGCKGMVSYVEANNESSLQSCWRLGCSEFGRIWVLGSGGRFWSLGSSGCRQYQFRFVSDP